MDINNIIEFQKLIKESLNANSFFLEKEFCLTVTKSLINMILDLKKIYSLSNYDIIYYLAEDNDDYNTFIFEKIMDKLELNSLLDIENNNSEIYNSIRIFSENMIKENDLFEMYDSWEHYASEFLNQWWDNEIGLIEFISFFDFPKDLINNLNLELDLLNNFVGISYDLAEISEYNDTLLSFCQKCHA
jgi:hypothetical protein